MGAVRARAVPAAGEISDRELLEAGVFDWAGKWPIARWLSINTARQYTTARSLVRRALRGRQAAAKPPEAGA